MKPKKLIMSAFGPYAEKTVVDLEKLGQKGIYLITGDTGAGKTTIFDGINFALYGEASGANRDANMFRSKYADTKTPTEVELYFSYGGKDYYIKRNPEYERQKSRGEGLTREKADAIFKYPDGRVVTKIKDVNQALQEVIGLDRNQFAQIAMIAQGDFLKLLLAETKERKEIFQKLFKTEKYFSLQERLKAEAAKLSTRYEELSQSITQYISGIDIGDAGEETALTVEKAKEGRDLDDEIINILDLLIKNDTELEALNKAKLLETEKQIEEITKLLTEAETLKTAKDSLDKSKLRLIELKESKKDLEEKLAAEEARKPEIEKIIKEIADIEAQIGDYTVLDDKKASFDALNKGIEADSKALLNKEREKAEKEKEIKALEIELAEFKDVTVDKVRLEADKKLLGDKSLEIYDLLAEFNNYDALKAELEKLQSLYINASNEAKDKKVIYEELNIAYLNEQAGILAEVLTPQRPCPVCGSLSHPSPAKKSPNAPDKKELERAKKDAENADKALNTASQNAGNTKIRLFEKEKTILTAVSRLLAKNLDIATAKAEISAEKKQLANELSVVDTKLAEIAKSINRKEQLEKDIPAKRERLRSLSDDISALDKTIVQNGATVKALKDETEKLSKKLKYESADEANKASDKLDIRRKALESAYDNAGKAVASCENDIRIETANIQNSEKLLKAAKDVDVENEADKKLALTAEKENILSVQKDIHSRIKANTDIKTSISEKLAEFKAVGEKWSWMKSLSNTANGNIQGKEKVMLETYVQASYFERIINRANQKLLIMTGGQYELIRQKTAENNKSQSGLDLNVIDHYNSSQRSVKTLSGGESFKASLALALGLSEEIQSSAGGIKLDTMFVDEGFGSLDEDSLSQAISALNSLAEGDRLVGIISHVAELKQKIEKQIVVTKEKTGGSKIKIVV